MATNLPRCLQLGRVCYANPDPAICQAASKVCWDGVVSFYDGESYKGGRNRFDITAPCDIDDLCYASTLLIAEYLNSDKVYEALAVPREQVPKYEVASDEVNHAFDQTADIAIGMTPQVQFLLASGIDVLVYQGKLDLACNTAGNLRWAEGMSWKGQPEFVSKDFKRWKIGGKEVGEFKEVYIGGVDGDDGKERNVRFGFVTIDAAGHMVPQDQPAAALDMLERWLDGRGFD